MKNNLLLLLTLVATTGSISAMEMGESLSKEDALYSMSKKTNEPKVSEKTKTLIEKFEDCLNNRSENECNDIKFQLGESFLDDDPKMQHCREQFPDNAKLVDNICAHNLPSLFNYLVKVEQLKLCVQAAKKQSTK
jgi:hypothetical protein